MSATKLKAFVHLRRTSPPIAGLESLYHFSLYLETDSQVPNFRTLNGTGILSNGSRLFVSADLTELDRLTKIDSSGLASLKYLFKGLRNIALPSILLKPSFTSKPIAQILNNDSGLETTYDIVIEPSILEKCLSLVLEKGQNQAPEFMLYSSRISTDNLRTVVELRLDPFSLDNPGISPLTVSVNSPIWA